MIYKYCPDLLSMRLLMLHSNSIEVIPRKQAIKSAEDAVKDEPQKMKDCLVVFFAGEDHDSDTKEAAEQIAKSVSEHAKQIGVKNVMLYPYVHLTSSPGSPKDALEIINLAEDKLSKDFEVEHSPFGWYKEFKIHVKGHPLAELSREF